MTLLTVFTPACNRSETLERAYKSLVNQTSKDFEWLIIDDGSQDNTARLVEHWIEENKITIKYVFQKNSGKTKSINKSLSLVNTPLWVCLDSDDYFLGNAVKIIISKYHLIKNDDKICGMIGLRVEKDGNLMQRQNIPENIKFIKQNILRYCMNIPPEYAQVYKTEVIKKYPYPEIRGENYFPLSYVGDQLDQTFSLLVIQEPSMVIEYQNDGITKNNTKHIINNPVGQTIFRHQQVELTTFCKQKIKAAIAYNSARLISKEIIKFNKISDRLLVILTFPLGVINYLIKFMKDNII